MAVNDHTAIFLRKEQSVLFSKSLQRIIVTLETAGELRVGCWRAGRIRSRVVTFKAIFVFNSSLVNVGRIANRWTVHTQVVSIRTAGHNQK